MKFPHRKFLQLAVGAVALLVVSPIAKAQTVPLLGYLTNAGADPVRLADFKSGLAELGYLEGKTIAFETRGARSNADYDALAAELVARPVTIIIGVNAAATASAFKATRTIPIVMTGVNDPVEWGFVKSLEQPGTNVTGTTLNAPQLWGERLKILKQLVPSLGRVSMLINGSNAANHPQFALLKSEADTLGIVAEALDVRLAQDVVPAIEKALGSGTRALLHANDSFINSQRSTIARLAVQHNVPVIYVDREYVVAGGLMSLGPGHHQNDVGAAKYVDRILRGASPADLPLALPTEFVFSVSRSRLGKSGLTLPAGLLARVNDRVE